MRIGGLIEAGPGCFVERFRREVTMTTAKESLRKLRALARSPNAHEAALALAKAQELEAKIVGAKEIAHAVAQLLKARGMTVRVRRRHGKARATSNVDAELEYFYSQSRYPPWHRIEIAIIEDEENVNE